MDNDVSDFTNLKYRLKQIDYNGQYKYSIEISPSFENNILPEKFTLNNNYPNPFNPTTTISYQIPEEGFTTMKIYDMLGKEIEVLVDHNQPASKYKVNFDGSQLTSGVYFCKLISGNNTKLIKMILVK